VPSSSFEQKEEGYVCPQCEIGGGYCPRHPLKRATSKFPDLAEFVPKHTVLDDVNEELGTLQFQKKGPPATPEEIKEVFKDIKDRLAS
jgi:hypothetical protein